MEITDILTRKVCAFDLAIQLIKNLNAKFKITIKVDKLVSKDWANIGISEYNVMIMRPSYVT